MHWFSVASALACSSVLWAISNSEACLKGRQRPCSFSDLPVYRYVGPCEEIPEGDDEFDSLNVPSFCRTGLRGQPGEMGEPGRAGFPGANGMIGEPGAPGAAGADGLIGPQGPEGPVGIQGPKGATGAIGLTGPAGIAGEDGPAGLTGPVGPDGPPGPTGPMSDPINGQVQGYLSSYNYAMVRVDNNEAIPFDNNGLTTNTIFHDTTVYESSKIFVVLSPGTYKITFLVLTVSSGAVALVINDELLLENTYEISAANQQIQGFLIEDFEIGDHFGIYHVNDTNAFMLAEPINASVIIEKLG